MFRIQGQFIRSTTSIGPADLLIGIVHSATDQASSQAAHGQFEAVGETVKNDASAKSFTSLGMRVIRQTEVTADGRNAQHGASGDNFNWASLAHISG